jgi:putative pyruvate formate lyase activating enzyme
LWSVLKNAYPNKKDTEKVYAYSKLDILQGISFSVMSQCSLCGWNCGVNRFTEKNAKCGLGSKAYGSFPFTHIAEEPVINPAIVTNLAGCALRCIYCIEHKIWDIDGLEPLDPKVYWERIGKLMLQGIPVNTFEFTNPTESLPGVISLLSMAPTGFNLSLVMNCHLYGSETFYELAGPITDVWLPDLRYGNDQCAKTLSGVDNYMSYARIGMDSMVEHGGRVVVRILVLPGHFQCCHEPSLKFLSEYKNKVWVSLLDQYVPEHEAYLDPNLKRRPTKNEINQVKDLVQKLGLRNIDTSKQSFWT